MTNHGTGTVVELKDLEAAIKSLKNNKACDRHGVSSEHLKHAMNDLAAPLIQILQKIQETCSIPLLFKVGLGTPLLKKGKKDSIPGNYRRITITAILSKILEKLEAPAINIPLKEARSSMQRGFTEGASSVNTAFLVTECIAEAMDNQDPVFITMLDAKSAFDVVAHPQLLDALYQLGVQGRTWLMLQDWYQGMSCEIKWAGMLSRVIKEELGLRQGGGLSMGQYVTYANENLLDLQNANLGMNIGTQYIGCPTCADDTALIHTNVVDMQATINV